MSRSGYYSWRRRGKPARQKEYEQLIPRVRELHRNARGIYGARRLADDIEELGVPCVDGTIKHDGSYYSSITSAYEELTTDNDSILITSSGQTKNLLFKRDVIFTLSGGFNCAFDYFLVPTTITGSMTISDGTVTVENITLK